MCLLDRSCSTQVSCGQLAVLFCMVDKRSSPMHWPCRQQEGGRTIMYAPHACRMHGCPSKCLTYLGGNEGSISRWMIRNGSGFTLVVNNNNNNYSLYINQQAEF